MGYVGSLNRKSGKAIRIGFFWGASIGLLLSLGITRLNTSEYSVANDLVFDLSRFSWRALTIPGHIFGSVLGLSPEFNSAEPALGDLALIVISNGLVFGAFGAFVGWRILKSRLEAECPQRSESEKMLDKGIPAKTVYWKTICRRGLWGLVSGMIINMVVIGIAVATSGGHSLTGYIAGYLAIPTYEFGNAVFGWPKSYTQYSLGLVIVVSAVNAMLISLLCVVITAITEIWLFFRKR
ncbi:MAG: hypothetical protein HOP33_14725 [Verrucomicrobia bacterium]|nr:hypothetical protein [Verrucomicrobiota bacterium]